MALAGQGDAYASSIGAASIQPSCSGARKTGPGQDARGRCRETLEELGVWLVRSERCRLEAARRRVLVIEQK